MLIRKIEPQDSSRFLNMLKKLDSQTNFMLYEPNERNTSIEEIKANIENTYTSQSLILIVEEDDEIIGFLSADRGFANRIKHSVYIVIGILKDYKGRGIGSNLFKELEKWSLDNKIKRLELTVMIHNESAINLYKKMGFKIEGIKEKSLIVDGKYIDEYYMSKTL